MDKKFPQIKVLCLGSFIQHDGKIDDNIIHRIKAPTIKVKRGDEGFA